MKTRTNIRRLTSLLLTLCLLLGTLPTAAASGTVTPTPPAWCPADEYAVFQEGAAYQRDTWQKILTLREHAASGALSPTKDTDKAYYDLYDELKKSQTPSVRFERGLLSAKYALNAAAQGKSSAFSTDFEMAASYGEGDEPACYLARLWNARGKLWSNDITAGLDGGLKYYAAAIEPLLAYEQFTQNQVLSWGAANGVSSERLDYARSLIFVTLDGDLVHPRTVHLSATDKDTTTAHIRDGRTMVPVRRIAELLGAQVSWENATRKVTIQRASDIFVMTIDSTEALRNGVSFQMDVAPYIVDGRTYIPVRYIAEFFGQSVGWSDAQRHVMIAENRGAVGGSNLEAWALPMGAMLNYMNNDDEAHLFGGKARFGVNPVGGAVSNRLETTGPDFGRQILRDSWGIESRADLIYQVCMLPAAGHNTEFYLTASTLSLLTPAQYQQLLSDSSPEEAAMYAYTSKLYSKWGEQGIAAWDAFRMSNLVQWGYLAGYITYPEALALLEPAADGLKELFTSWDQAYENYLDGYHWWARQPVTGDIWATERGQLYQAFRQGELAHLFDDALFRTEIIPVPGVTAEELYNEAVGALS